MKDNLYTVTFCSHSGHAQDRKKLRINDPIVVGQQVTAMKDNINLSRVRLLIVRVEGNTVYGRIVKKGSKCGS